MQRDPAIKVPGVGAFACDGWALMLRHGKTSTRMSALGHKHTLHDILAKSALPPKRALVEFAGMSANSQQGKSGPTLFDHPVGERKDRFGDSQP